MFPIVKIFKKTDYWTQFTVSFRDSGINVRLVGNKLMI